MANPLPPGITWHAMAQQTAWGYARTSNEAFENCAMIFSELSALGWTLNAIAAVCGNIEVEGIYNPWSWEDRIPLASTDTSLIDTSLVHGYGLVGWTPSGKYLHDSVSMNDPDYAPYFSDIPQQARAVDGASQIRYMHRTGPTYYSNSSYSNFPANYAEFIIGEANGNVLSTDDLTEAWMRCYERPASYSSLPTRQDAARYWYQTLLPYDPNPPGPVYTRKKMPLWMMLRRY